MSGPLEDDITEYKRMHERDVEICRLQEEVKSLRAARAEDQQRLLHYEHQLELGGNELERLQKDVKLLEASRREIIEIDEARVVEIARLKKIIQNYEDERISKLGGIGSPA